LRLDSGPARSPLSDGKTNTVDSRVTTRDGFLSSTVEKHLSYPLTLDYSFVVNADGSYTQSAASTQQDLARESQSVNGVMAYESNLDNEVNATGTLNWDSSGNFLGPSGSTTRQAYRIRDSLGRCDDRALNATEQKLTSVAGGPWLRPPQALTDPCHRPSVPQLAAASSIIQAQSPLQPDVLQLQHTEALAAKWLSPQGKETSLGSGQCTWIGEPRQDWLGIPQRLFESSVAIRCANGHRGPSSLACEI
jgi:hypothetical protein